MEKHARSRDLDHRLSLGLFINISKDNKQPNQLLLLFRKRTESTNPSQSSENGANDSLTGLRILRRMHSEIRVESTAGKGASWIVRACV